MMKAAFLTKEGFELRTIEKPVCKADEVLIKVFACGVCAGDLFVYLNRETMAESYPRLGHESSGVVEAVGEEVTQFEVGDVVTTFGLHAYSEAIVTKPETVVKLPKGVDPRYALGEPLACCVHAGWRFNTQPGDRVAIIGCGFMGLICQQIVKSQGAGYILSVDPLDERCEIAKGYGADDTVNPLEMSVDEIKAYYGEFDVVIEAAGNQSALDTCTPLVKEHGRIVLIGYHQTNGGYRTVNMEQWNLKAIDVVNGHVRRENEKLEAMRTAMTMMEEGKLSTKAIVTFYAFDDIRQAFYDLSDRKKGLFKAVIEMV